MLISGISLKYNRSVSLPAGELLEAIKRDFGSFQKMKEKMSAATVAVQGSGWGWLGYDKESGSLRVAACANQDPLHGTTGPFGGEKNIGLWLCFRGLFFNLKVIVAPSLTRRSRPAPRYRRVGARLLPPVQKRAARLCQGHLECSQLGECERASPVCQEVKADLQIVPLVLTRVK